MIGHALNKHMLSYVKEIKISGTHQLWKSEMGFSCGKLLGRHCHGLKTGKDRTSEEIDGKIRFCGITLDLITSGGLRRADFFRQAAKESMTGNAQVIFCRKIGEEKMINHQYFSARVESTGIPTWS